MKTRGSLVVASAREPRVGSYGESYDCNLGEGSQLKIVRSLNALSTKAGILYAPPIR